MAPRDGSLVTCVIIFLDAERYLAEAIASVRAQTSDRWELVLVDDGSTDGSTRIARDAAASDPHKIQYVEHPGHANRGMSASRNAGVSAGHGDYIAFLDSDDVWLPEWVETFLATALRFPAAGMIYGPTLYWYDWLAPEEQPPHWRGNFIDRLGMPIDQLIAAPGVLRSVLIADGPEPPCICSLLIRADAYRSVGGFEEDFRGLYEDQVFLSKITYHHDIVVIGRILAKYRQHDDSCCHRGLETREYHPEDYHPARARFLLWLQAYLKAQPGVDPVLLGAIAARCRPYQIPFYAASANFVQHRRRQALRIHRQLRIDPRLAGARQIWALIKRMVRRGRPKAEISPSNPQS